MARRVLWLSVLAGLAVFGACVGALALLRLGVPFPLAALGLALLAGTALYMLLHAWLARPMAELADLREGAAAARTIRARLAELEADASGLRHALHGALHPARPAADHLLAHGDPAVRRAGEAVAEAVGRADSLLSQTGRG